ncbi:sigma-70 family RNA polymerase sigma factor [Paeniglutamicibacter cryotolerans]|uniref:RNA polymerase sigma factor for flagellar operon FliA n=1 Tax=Paeniglutamicibacter cryotolerans TaxID=670079 RepID=A0A839QIQ7_9MICC|nr:sigma-70 family RNA polymerase sigma factor [Paeniglutamicibacter cryotolerans]MBB2993906.1 RNA polymerase sigma factor for flagellar operon FliA [Paeniglutamicibacter cryotolerans]
MDQDARNRLVVENLPLVGYLASELCAKATHLSREDLVSVGAIALMTAAGSYNSALGVPFGAYARRRIVGAFADDMRSNDWATRGARRRMTETRSAQEALSGALGRQPTVAELAETMGISQGEVLAVLGNAERTVVGIDDAMADYLSSDTQSPEEQALDAERTQTVRSAVDALPENLRLVIESVYFRGSTVKELAAELGVTHSAVSQRRTAAIKLIQEGLQSGYLSEEKPAVPIVLTRSAERRREEYLAEFGQRTAGGLTRNSSASSGFPVNHEKKLPVG